MSEKFFASLSSQNDSRWMLDNLCSKQQKYPLAGAVAFKWKPFPATFFGQPAKAALETVALSDSPQIRVIRNRRNLLDVVISSYKHKRANVKAHCLRGDKRCLLRHQKAGTSLVLPTKELLNRLKTLSDAEDRVDRMLEEMEVPHVQVTYERLYYAQGSVLASAQRLDHPSTLGINLTKIVSYWQASKSTPVDIRHV